MNHARSLSPYTGSLNRRDFIRAVGGVSGWVVSGAVLPRLAAAVQGADSNLVWRNLGAGGGGWMPCLAVSPFDSSVVYAGCDIGGFFKSVDGGGSWRICNTGLHNYYVEVILPHPRDPKILYLGTEGGMHKSNDGGESWTWLRDGFPPPASGKFSAPIGAVAFDPHNPEVLYAGIGRPRFGKSGAGAIYRSGDGGVHWQRVNPNGGGLDPAAIISDLLLHPHESSRIFAATDRGLYRSDDSGATWRRLGRGLPHQHTRRVALCPAQPEIMYLTLEVQSGEPVWQGGVYRSEDGGESWSPRLEGLGHRAGKAGEAFQMTSNVDRLIVHPQRPDVVFAGDVSWVTAGVYVTENGGKTWATAFGNRTPRNADYGWLTKSGPSVMGLAMDPRAPGTVFFSTSMQIYRTLDGGQHWTQCYTRNVPKPPRVTAPVTEWWATSGLETTCLLDLVVHPREPERVCFCYQDIGMIQSFDRGQTFALATHGMKNPGNVFTIAFDPEDARIAFAGSGWWEHNAGDVCRSEDGGLTWKVVGSPQSGLPDGQTRQLIVDRSSSPSARRVFVAVTGQGVFCSEDGGTTWRARNQGLPHGGIRALVQQPAQPAVLWVVLAEKGNDLGGIYQSDDSGQNWRRKSAAFVCPDAKTLVVSPSDPRRLYLAVRQKFAGNQKVYPGGVFSSRDGGATWERVLENHFIQGLAIHPHNPDVVYAGGNDHPYHDEAIGLGVVASNDGGRTWRSLNSPGLSLRNIACLTVDPHQPNRLYAGTAGNGVFVAEL